MSRLRSRRTKPASTPSEKKKKKPLKRKSSPSSESDYDMEKDVPSIKPLAKKVMTA
ncbi:hypothetical protein A2U01_0104256, partial [Trifolium medium]|nr:hypothetical protein [Trifolium medium]